MERIANTIEYCQKLAIEIGHNLGEFQLVRLGHSTLILTANCTNDECWWNILFDAYGPKGRYGDGTEVNIISPEKPIFIEYDCQALRNKPNENEIEILKISERRLKEIHPDKNLKYFTKNQPRPKIKDLVFDEIGSEREFLETRCKIRPDYSNERSDRRRLLESWLLTTFPLANP